MPDYSRWQTDVLFPLVGTYPLPNYAAIQLLAKQEGLLVLLTGTPQVVEPESWQL